MDVSEWITARDDQARNKDKLAGTHASVSENFGE
jgi:hypothetical protein